jgi:hypothetical protein
VSARIPFHAATLQNLSSRGFSTRNADAEPAFALHHNKEIAMDNSIGKPGAETPEESARRIKQSAADVVERGKEAATHAAERGVNRAVNSADSAASALRRAAADIEPDNRLIGAALRKSAEGIEQATRSLGDGDLSHALDDLNAFARRNPAMFLGASLALGFALARVGKTAIEDVQAGQSEQTGDGAYNPYASSVPGM